MPAPQKYGHLGKANLKEGSSRNLGIFKKLLVF